MSMKPCSHEQEVLLALLGEVSPAGRLRATLHTWLCPDCRERRREYVKLGAALMSLRPGYSIPVRSVGSSRYSLRLSLVAAVLALAVAALSFYLARDPIIDDSAKFVAGPAKSGAPLSRDCEDDPAAAARPAEKAIAKRGSHRTSK